MRITTVVQWIRLGLLAGTAHAQEPRAEPVVSNNANDVLIRGNDLVKTGANVAWDAGASFQSITAGHDGYVEFTAGPAGVHRMVGLSHADTDRHQESIDFGLMLAYGGSLCDDEVRALTGSL